MVDNVSMAAPAQVTQNTKELTENPTQVTTHTQNSMDTGNKKITKRKMVEREAMMMEIILLLHQRIYIWVMWVDRLMQVLVAFPGPLMTPPTPPPSSSKGN